MGNTGYLEYTHRTIGNMGIPMQDRASMLPISCNIVQAALNGVIWLDHYGMTVSARGV